MKSPNPHARLADAIEALVASYIEEVRVAAEQAVSRSLGRPVVATRTSKSSSHRSGSRRSATTRRSQAELDQVCEALHKLVRARPGESMVAFATELGATVRMLERPMAKLKAEGRVRSVGQRHLMRYFPAVVRASSGKE